MILRACSLDFHQVGGYSLPKDRALHKMAVQFAEKHLAEVPNFSEFGRVWVAAEVDENDQPQSIQGALGFTMRPDFTLCRFLNRQALITLYNRANGFLSDNGCRGAEALVYVSSTEGPEQRCPQQKESLEALGARAADRYVIKIR